MLPLSQTTALSCRVCIFQVMVNVQMLAELEEVIQFKLVPERREVIREMWWNRLRVFWFP